MDSPNDSATVLNGMIASYKAECEEQPQRLALLCRAYEQDEQIRSEIRRLKRTISGQLPLLWVGMGASYCSMLSGSVRMQSSGRLSFASEAGEWLHNSDGTRHQIAGPILVTTSGESAELVELCRQPSNKPSILLCNEAESSCWSAAQIRFPILAGLEHGNASKSYTNATAACIILASELVGLQWKREAAIAIEGFTNSLGRVFERRKEFDQFRQGATTIEVVGRGPALGGALMGALCIREMTGFRAGAHSGASFRHGPLLDVDDSHLSIIQALGPTAELGVRLAKDCVARGGRVILVETNERRASERLLPVKIDTVPEPWEGITSVLVSQAITAAMIERLGTKYVRICTVVE
jgi:glucosamine--fructose-6-phosphate aminotransferase (isomerizing)